MTSPASAATLSATPSAVTICASQTNQPAYLTVTETGATLGTLTLSLTNNVFRAEVVATGQVGILLQQTVTATTTDTLTITDTTNSVSTTVLLTAQVGGTCTPSGGGGTGTVTASPNPVTLSAAPGSFGAQTLVLTAPAGSTYSITPVFGNCASGWLSASPNNGTTTATTTNITVFGTTSNITSGTCTGSLSILVGATTTLSVTVNFTVGAGSGGLTTSPTALSFVSTTTQALSITDYSATSFTAYTSTQSGGNWLTVNGNYSASGSLPTAVLSVGVNTSGLSTGVTYTGIIQLYSTPDNGSVQISVSVTPGGSNNPALQATPSSISLSSPAGSSTLVSQTLYLTSNTSGLTYTAQATTNSGGSWLIVAPGSGAIPTGAVTIYANPAALAAGTYNGNVIFTTQGSVVTTTVVPVQFVVGGGVAGQVAPASLSFAYQASVSGSAPPQTLLVNGAPGTSYTTSITLNNGANWLSVSPSNGTFTTTSPASLTVSIANIALAQGTYTGQIGVTTSSGTQNVPVTLIVSTSPVLTANPGSVTFQVQAGAGSPPTQYVSLNTSNAVSLSYSATASNSWITVTNPVNLTTPAFLGVQVNTTGLPSGLNSGSISFLAPGAGNSPMVVPVVVAVIGGVAVAPTSINFTAVPGGSSPSPQTLSLSATTATAFVASASTTNGGNWLSVSPNTATTPANVTVTATSTGLTAGTYIGNIAISAGGATQSIPVTLTVSTGGGGGVLTFNPTSLTFTGTAGGAPPSVQGVQVSATLVGQGFLVGVSTASGGPWLSAVPSTGAAPTTLSVTVNPANLTAGTYQGTITVTPTGGASQTIPITFNVAGLQTVTVSPATLSFAYQTGDSAPDAQTITVGPATGTAIPFTATAASTGNWLVVTPASGSSPLSLSASVNTSGLTAGNYTGTITVTPTSGGGTSQVVNVTLAVTAPLPTLARVVNGASYVGGALAPGEIVTLFGTSIGPKQQATLTLDSAGKVATTLGNVQVLFDGTPAPMIFASATQVSVVVPYEVSGRSTTSVWVKFAGVSSNAINMGVTTTAPGLFTLDASGSGPGAILNQDASVNSTSNPASPGSIVVLYATGEGQTVPAGTTGGVTPVQNIPAPVLPVAVLIDGQPATILYAGEAPGMVAGVMQVNARIPAGVSSGQKSVVVSVGGNSSQNGVTLAVR